MADKTRLCPKLSGDTWLFLMIIALSGQFMTASTPATKLSPSSKPGLRQSTPNLYSQPGLRQSTPNHYSQPGLLLSIPDLYSQPGLRQSTPNLYSQPDLQQSKSGSLSDAGFQPLLDLAQSQAGQNSPTQDQPI